MKTLEELITEAWNYYQNINKGKFVKFISDGESNHCQQCLTYNGQIFKEDDPDRPELPIHPNCRCKYESVENPELEKIKERLSVMDAELQKYAHKVAFEVQKILKDINVLRQQTSTVKGKIETALLYAKIAALIISIQCALFIIEKIKSTVNILHNVVQKLNMKVGNASEEMISLFKAPADLTSALKEFHYLRLIEPDQTPKNLPESPEEAIKRGFVKAPDNQNRYHRNNGATGNEKYYHPVTGQEVVFDKSGKIETAPANIGTKNYGSDPKSGAHVLYDVLPYWIWGNSEDDKTPFYKRVWGSGK